MFATDSNGAVVWTASYLPFGGVHASTGDPIALRFPGQWFQSESGLHQNWMRDYDPTTGRYIQADPLGLVDGASVYGYAQGNPGRYVDPRGEFGVPGAIAGAVVGATAGYLTSGCWKGALLGAGAGAAVGASGAYLEWAGAALVGGGSAAVGQAVAFFAIGPNCGRPSYECGGDEMDPETFSDFVTSRKFWMVTAGGALGSGGGALLGGRISTTFVRVTSTGSGLGTREFVSEGISVAGGAVGEWSGVLVDGIMR